MSRSWKDLQPHRPLRQGDVRYAELPGRGAGAIAAAVLGGYRRVAVVGPMGIGKSSELAAAEHLLSADLFTFRRLLDLELDMRTADAEAVLRLVLRGLAEVSRETVVAPRLADVEHLTSTQARDRLILTLRAHGRSVLLLDGLEKCGEANAGRLATELFELGAEAAVVLVLPQQLAYGPAAAQLDDVRFVFVPPVDTGEVEGRLFLRELALRHIGMPSVPLEKTFELALVDEAVLRSGGVPRVLLQLLRDAYRHGSVRGRAAPVLEDLEAARREHGAFLRRLLLPGDRKLIEGAIGTDGAELPLDAKLRLYAQGILLEHTKGGEVVLEVAPTLAAALRLRTAA